MILVQQLNPLKLNTGSILVKRQGVGTSEYSMTSIWSCHPQWNWEAQKYWKRRNNMWRVDKNDANCRGSVDPKRVSLRIQVRPPWLILEVLPRIRHVSAARRKETSSLNTHSWRESNLERSTSTLCAPRKQGILPSMFGKVLRTKRVGLQSEYIVSRIILLE